MKSSVVQGSSILAWILGATERVGVSELPADQFSEPEVGQITFPLSPAAKELALLRFAMTEELNRKHEDAKKAGDEVHDAFDLELGRFGEPVVRMLEELMTLQVALDAIASGIEVTSDHAGFSFLSNGEMAIVTKTDLVREALLSMAHGMRKTG